MFRQWIPNIITFHVSTLRDLLVFVGYFIDEFKTTTIFVLSYSEIFITIILIML